MSGIREQVMHFYLVQGQNAKPLCSLLLSLVTVNHEKHIQSLLRRFMRMIDVDVACH